MKKRFNAHFLLHRTRILACVLLLAMGALVFAAPISLAAEETYAPDMESGWGKQNNNGWYYMYEKEGQYAELDWRDGTAEIPWQQNNFAFDPTEMAEMLFISKVSFFTGELGSKPVYAFKAPKDGNIRLDFTTHGTEDMRLSVYHGSNLVQVEGRDAVLFDTSDHTPHSATMDVKKGDMVFLVGSTVGANREGWVQTYSVTYLSSSGDADPGITQNPKTGDGIGLFIAAALLMASVGGCFLLVRRSRRVN